MAMPPKPRLCAAVLHVEGYPGSLSFQLCWLPCVPKVPCVVVWWCPAGALPLRVSPSKTPVRGDKDDRESRQKGQRGNKNQQQQQALQPPPGMEAQGSLQSPQGSGAVPAEGSAASALNSSDSGVVEGPTGRASSGTSTQDDTAAQAALEIAQQMQQQLQIDAPGADAAAEAATVPTP